MITKLYTEKQLIELIENHKSVVAPHNEYYQLAHDHIIILIKESRLEVDLNNIYIEGYRLKDLLVIAERLRKDYMEPRLLEADNETFLAGYKMASEDFLKSIDEAVKKIMEG